jgi:hypothetical protein
MNRGGGPPSLTKHAKNRAAAFSLIAGKTAGKTGIVIEKHLIEAEENSFSN